MTIVEARPGTGSFTGYASTFGGDPDREGDIVERGAFARVTVALNAGAVTIPVVASPIGGGHGTNDPRDVVGIVRSAVEDAHGWRIEAEFAGDADSQVIRQKVLAGALSMSIGYRVRPGGERALRLADGRMGRVLTDLDVLHVALTPVAMNPAARVLSAKHGAGAWPPVAAAGAARVVTVAEEIGELQRGRGVDDGAEHRRKAAVLADSWVSTELIERLGVEAAYRLHADAMAAQWRREQAGAVPSDPVHVEAAARAARWDEANARDSAAKAFDEQAARRAANGDGCGACYRCLASQTDLCVYGR